jgi:endoglucanase
MRWKTLLRTALFGTALLRTALICLLALPLPLLAAGSAAAASPISLTSGFYSNPDSGPAAWVRNNPSDARAARIQSAVASQPIARWFANESGGIGPAVANYVGAADSHDKLPVLVAYNIPGRDACGGESSGGAGSVAAYRTWISTFAAAVGDRPAVVVIEPDALSDFSCLTGAQISDRLAMLAYATQMFQQKAPNTWAYLDAGHTNWVAPATMASRLNSAGVRNIRGFSLNVSNFYTTASSETYGNSLERRVVQSGRAQTRRHRAGGRGRGPAAVGQDTGQLRRAVRHRADRPRRAVQPRARRPAHRRHLIPAGARVADSPRPTPYPRVSAVAPGGPCPWCRRAR